jgi:hypothetical protein
MSPIRFAQAVIIVISPRLPRSRRHQNTCMVERTISSASTQQKARKMNGPNLSRIELLRKKCGDSASPKFSAAGRPSR